MRTGLLFAPLLFAAGLSAQPAATRDGFAIPQPGHRFSFPADYGAHPAFKTEWWYVTGQLSASGGRPFGFQATFFRIAGPRGGGGSDPNFSPRQVFLTHMALTDIAGKKFWHEERLNREGWDACAAEGDLDLRNGNWSMRRTGPAQGSSSTPTFTLHGGVQADAAFELTLAARKPLVVFGTDGVSRKGSDPSAASYYLTFSRLDASGRLTLGTTTFDVRGEAWMDHEISSSQLGAGQVGWDWVCVQFHGEPRELMLYRMRRADGTADPASMLQWVSPESRAVTEPFSWKVESRWKSPHDGAVYPARVRLATIDPDTGSPVNLVIEALLADQELANLLGGGPYWEGACRVLNSQSQPVGSAYLELTGYAKPLKF